MVDDLKNAFRKQNNGLVQIILINVIVFLIMVTLLLVFRVSGKDTYFAYVRDYLFLPGDIRHFLVRPWTLVTYFFIHDLTGIGHIFFNMLFLYWFGKLIDEYLGNRRLVNLYILGGLAGGITFLLLANLVPSLGSGTRLIGASGAVYAVVVGAATLMPNYTFFLFLLGPVRIKYIAAFYVVISYIGLAVGGNAGGDAAHLGGALMGFIFITQLNKGNDLGRPLTRLTEWVQRLFRPKPKMKVTYRNAVGGAAKGTSYSGMPDDEEIDAILDKINRSGYESLTKEEKQKLFRASQKN